MLESDNYMQYTIKIGLH